MQKRVEGGALTGRAGAGKVPGVLRTLREFFQRPDTRAMAENLAWIVAERLARLTFNVVVGILVARYLGPAQFGLYSYAFAFASIGLAIAEAGVEAAAKRELLRRPEAAGSVLAAAARLRWQVGAAAYAGLAAWAWWGEPAGEERRLLLLLGLLLFQPALAVADLWLQARLQARLATRAQVVALACGAASRLVLVGAAAPLWAFAVAAVVEAALAAGLMTLAARKVGRPTATSLAPALGAELWRDAWPMLLAGLSVMIYLRIDIVMLRRMAGEAPAGIYAAAVRLSELGSFLPGAIASTLLPRLLAARAAGPAEYGRMMQRFFDLNVAVAAAVAIPTVLLAPWLVRLIYGPSFAEAAPVLAVHGWTLIWAGLGVARGQYCVNEGLTRFHLAATVGGAIANIGLNAWLIPLHGARGAAWATLIAMGLVAWGSSFCHAGTRACAAMQTRALLFPFRAFRLLR